MRNVLRVGMGIQSNANAVDLFMLSLMMSMKMDIRFINFVISATAIMK